MDLMFNPGAAFVGESPIAEKAAPSERKRKEEETHKLFFDFVAALITLTLCFANSEASSH